MAHRLHQPAIREECNDAELFWFSEQGRIGDPDVWAHSRSSNRPGAFIGNSENHPAPDERAPGPPVHHIGTEVSHQAHAFHAECGGNDTHSQKLGKLDGPDSCRDGSSCRLATPIVRARLVEEPAGEEGLVGNERAKWHGGSLFPGQVLWFARQLVELDDRIATAQASTTRSSKDVVLDSSGI
ncbi:uncharacterized protein P884DRAFT_268415 [Thermothelomyces heterothallicus CBS 202.75]|uniref:uncharacterized protein n=1 Tax=Thermothelomyces heterothallicus CBS 202.75 TaxID=1149848 RepID=UPI00374383C5